MEKITLQKARSIIQAPSYSIYFSGEKKFIEALTVISESGSLSDISSVFSFITHKKPTVSKVAMGAIKSLMDKLEPKMWTTLYDQWKYLDIRESHLLTYQCYRDDQAFYLFGLATLNRSGYIREAALINLGSIKKPEAMPYLLLRLADWVPTIHELAAKLVMERIDAEHFGVLIRNFPLIQWMDRVKRVNLSDISNKILTFLGSESSKKEMTKLLGSKDFHIRLFCFKTLARNAYLSDELFQAAISDELPLIRIWLAGHYLIKNQKTNIERCERLLDDKVAHVRAAALNTISDELWDGCKKQIMNLLFDKTKRVRSRAQFLVKKREKLDLVHLYRKAVDLMSDIKPGAIAGLGETGDKQDIKAVSKFLSHPKCTIRVIALGAIFGIDPEQGRDAAIAALSDPRPRVRKLAIAVLLTKKSRIDISRVKSLLESGSKGQRIAALTVMLNYGKWDSLESALFCITQNDQELVNRAWDGLIEWRKRSTSMWIRPQPETYARIKDFYEELIAAEIDVPIGAKKAWSELGFIIENAKII